MIKSAKVAVSVANYLSISSMNIKKIHNTIQYNTDKSYTGYAPLITDPYTLSN